ncbi:MAG: efflux RND transporter periplasmic adaptor subunit [Caulobacteraceae bacterium]|nr:efflux RND transporter periplasmic adaptor subunit [Caulobacteraceae bacterium]
MDRTSQTSIPPALAAAAAALSLAACTHPAQTGAKPTPVAIADVAQGPVADERVGLGAVQAYNLATVRAQTQGPILEVLFTEGQSVAAGQPIAQIDPRPLEAALAQDLANAARDQASLANAERLVARDTPLAPNGVVSAEQLDAQRTQAAQLRASVAADAAVVQRDRLELAYATVRAPAAGVTGLRLKDVGDLVGPTDPQGLVTIAQIQPIAVVFTLPQADLPAVRAAMAAAGPAGLEVDADAQGSGERIDAGRLLMIDNQVDQTTGAVSLKAVFPNAARQLWPGEFVSAHLVLGRTADALTLPTSAIQRNDRGTYVWTIDTAGAAHPQPVSASGTLGGRTLIAGGLKAGQPVVVDGQFALTPGARVVAGLRPQPAPVAAPSETLGSLQ